MIDRTRIAEVRPALAELVEAARRGFTTDGGGVAFDELAAAMRAALAEHDIAEGPPAPPMVPIRPAPRPDPPSPIAALLVGPPPGVRSPFWAPAATTAERTAAFWQPLVDDQPPAA